MARGDHIKVQRPLYWHHGIDLGDGTVIHSSGEPGQLNHDARVRRTSLARFLRGGEAIRVGDAQELAAEEVAARAEAALGEKEYSLLFNNCEHFARWCQTGRHESGQVDRLVLGGALVGVAARLAVSVAARRATGAVLLRVLLLVGPLAAGIALISTSVALVAKLRQTDR
jgi:hypothetical protein